MKKLEATCKCVLKDVSGKFNYPKRGEDGEVIYNEKGEVKHILQGEFHQVFLSFVGSDGNCWQETREPHGTIPLICLTPEAAVMFEVGKVYKMTIEEVVGAVAKPNPPESKKPPVDIAPLVP